MKPVVTVTKTDKLPELKAALSRLVNTDVLVGWPESANPRQEEGIGNAALAYILTKGSPLQGIPATPILEPAITLPENKHLIGAELGQAAKSVLDGDTEAAQQELNKAGMVATNAVKRFFVDPRNGWPPNSPSTIRRKGSDRRNIDTAQLRRSVTYVVRDKK